VEICFANPGTTELALVAAMDTVKNIRPVLGLFEGVCTGAADGYGRIKQKPAMTVLHLGPGFANGIANLHNARRARTPVLNIIGEHTTWIRPYDPPLNMDIASLARTVSGWQRESKSVDTLSADTASAIGASLYGQIATMIVPADFQAEPCPAHAVTKTEFSFDPPDEKNIAQVCAVIKKAKKPAMILGGRALRGAGLAAAAQIKAKTGCDLLMITFPAYFDCGEGFPVLKRIPYFPGQAQKLLGNYDAFVLAGATDPVAFFGYAGGVTSFLPDSAPCVRIDTERQDAGYVLTALASALGLDAGQSELRPVLADLSLPPLPAGALNSQKMCAAIAALQPEHCIVVEEGVTSGAPYYTFAPQLRPYSQMTLTGGAIGMGLPLALGAALAAPDRQVIDIQADGSAMYTLQALWSQAREKAKVITVICSNRKYFTIEFECLRAGYKSLGKEAKSLMSLDSPPLDWVSLSRGMGVPAASVTTAEAFIKEFQAALKESGPYLIEAILE
jgi:acetolactate synthase-1/2/3 large subunit